MTSDGLSAAIGRAISDVLDAVNSYAAEQVTLAVTPREAVGKPETWLISGRQLYDMLRAAGLATTGTLTGPVCEVTMQINLLHQRAMAQEPGECCASSAARNRQLGQLAAEMLGHFTGAGLLAPSVIAQVHRSVIQRWEATLAGAARQSAHPQPRACPGSGHQASYDRAK